MNFIKKAVCYAIKKKKVSPLYPGVRREIEKTESEGEGISQTGRHK